MTALKPLCVKTTVQVSRGSVDGLPGSVVVKEGAEDLASDKPLEAADDVLLAEALCRTFGDVVHGGLMPAHTDRHDSIERRIGLTMAATREPVPVGHAARVACLINATWLFAAHQDSDIRAPGEAVRLGQLAAMHGRGSEIESAALDALAAAFAAAGRYDDAVETAVKADALAGESRRQQILERLSLYRQHLPFRVTSERPKQLGG